MFKSLIIKLRQKPKAVRDNIALGVAGTFTFIVFCVWIYHVPTRFNDNRLSDNANEASPGFSQLISALKDEVSSSKESRENDDDETDQVNTSPVQFESRGLDDEDWLSTLNISSTTKPAAPLEGQEERKIIRIATTSNPDEATTTSQ